MLVFLCHSSQDKAAVRQLYRNLSRDGFDVWFDEERLLPGQDWNMEITRAVRTADTVLICLSHRSVTKSGYYQKEIRLTLDAADEKPDGAIFLIPVKLEECDVPERISRFQ
jgi:squalene cyclase